MVLQLFLVLPYLLLHFVKRSVEGRADLVSFGRRDKIVLVFGVDKNFNSGFFVLEIDCYVDFSDALKIGEQLFGFSRDVLTCFGANGAVSTRDVNIHEFNLSASRVVNQASKRLPAGELADDMAASSTTPLGKRSRFRDDEESSGLGDDFYIG